MQQRLKLAGIIFFIVFLAVPQLFADETKAAAAENKDNTKKTEKTSQTDKKKKVAVVNDTVITQSDLDQEMAPVRQQLSMQGKPNEDQLAEIRKQVLGEMVRRELLWQESQKKGFVISDKDVDAKVKEFKSRFPTEEAFTKGIEQMGISMETVRNQIRQQEAIQKLIEDRVVSKIDITDADTKSYYDENPDMFKQPEQVKASHILIKVDSKASDADKAAAKKKIEGIQKELAGGADFAELAKKKSEGPSGKNGGDLGYFGRGQMVKPFEEAAFALDKGKVSEIVETQFGFHVIKMFDKKAAGKMTYADVQPKIKNILQKRRVRDAVEKYIESLKKDAKVEVLL